MPITSPMTLGEESRLLARLRRRAQWRSERICKAREGTRLFADYGPYLILDQRNAIVRARMDIAALAEWYGELVPLP